LPKEELNRGLLRLDLARKATQACIVIIRGRADCKVLAEILFQHLFEAHHRLTVELWGLGCQAFGAAQLFLGQPSHTLGEARGSDRAGLWK